MPSINRIRVNNVKYNFGTQFYDDFTMRLYGKNTLYDLANGGGKSVLMLLLLQNMIPNCTLDDKQPIEKLFRTGNGNTTIHSLVEWKLDDPERNQGYKYMTTGFCARKAKDAGEEAETDNDVASIEYFNYCIFYREYNKNDIINLPLVSQGERVTFQGLRTYLKELEHRDMSLMVRIFDRKGEYQRFISDFGIHESQWEIIRGINKTEGHVRTYFENNYKTTRRVVEDLLIEEIIEKAFLVKTNREDSGEDSMAKMLMDIKEQLTILSKKKKDISNYDHQIELIGVLTDKVQSFMNLYKEQNSLRSIIADIFVTGEQFAKDDEQRMEELARARDEKREQKNRERARIECLKVMRDKYQLEEYKNEVQNIDEEIKLVEGRRKKLVEDLKLKEAVNEYIEYIDDRKKYYQHEAALKTILMESDFDEELLYTYAYNIKMRMDVLMTDIRGQIAAIEDSIKSHRMKKEYHQKMSHEAELNLAVARNVKATIDSEIAGWSERLSNIRMTLNTIKFSDVNEQLGECENECRDKKEAIEACKKQIEELNLSKNELQAEINNLESVGSKLQTEINSLSDKKQEYAEIEDKLRNIRVIYGAKDEDSLKDVIGERITEAVLDIARIKKDIAACNKRIARLAEGRALESSKAVDKVLEYIETRHGITAMFGADYMSALDDDAKKKVLENNPMLPYGIITKDFDELCNDPNLRNVDTENQVVNIYDMDEISNRAFVLGDNVISVYANDSRFTDKEAFDEMITKEQENCRDLKLQLSVKEETLVAYREDQAFVLRVSYNEFLDEMERLKELIVKKEENDERISLCEEKLRQIKGTLGELQKQQEKDLEEYEMHVEDVNKLYAMKQLSEMLSEQEERAKENQQEINRLEAVYRELKDESGDDDIDELSLKARLKTLEGKYSELEQEWNQSYKQYYNVGEEYEVLTAGDDELKARFIAMIDAGSKDAKTIEDKKLLMDTIKISMERSLKNIEKSGVNLDVLKELDRNNKLYLSDEDMLYACRKEIDDVDREFGILNHKKKDKDSAINRLEGSIEYAISNIEAAFGRFEETDVSASEIISSLENSERLLDRLEQEATKCDEEFRQYRQQQGYMLDLYKDVKRIVDSYDIDLKDASPITYEKDKLREIFEEKLILFDRNAKNLSKAQNELNKFKGNTALALEQMSVFELANTIREDVEIPENYDSANELVDNLRSISGYVKLERDRVEKSLVDMETIKANFEEQCLQRCLDVKTELDKLPKLSRIISDGETIQMVGLSVPYVKEEFLRQRMSDYIDRIVAQADDYNQDKDRIKFIRGSLALKRLFGVIVTDMNGIKLTLYKRERIKEQSRYLRYEEAVGSTGQSQGIYIQFLVSIINYISGMYQTGNEDTRTKTIFIDNPFGAAKDVYIWEPIFALLAANKVQLIVPARGATPAITGKFDVNYILGQQMTGGKQLTVVTDYTSKVDQEELEYSDLSYEQVSFDFI